MTDDLAPPPASFETGAPGPTRDPPRRPYGLLGLVVSSVVILVPATLVAVILGRVDLDPSGGKDPDFDTHLTIGAGLLMYVVLSASVLAAARLRGGRAWRDMVGWRPWHPFRRAWFFWVLLAATLAYAIGADDLVTAIHPEARNWMPQPSGALWDVLFVALAAILAPLTEELFFRGWIYTSLRLSIGVPLAILVSAAGFALAHWESTHLYAAVIFPVGLALGVIRERTGSIAASIAFHALYNGFAAVLLLMH